MANKGYIVAIKILALIMFIYGSWLCYLFLPLVIIYSFEFFQKGGYSLLPILLLLIGLFIVALNYLIGGIGMLRLKKWGMVISVYNAILTVILSFVVYLSLTRVTVAITSFSPFNIGSGVFLFLIIILVFLIAPALFFLLVFTRTRVKSIFKEVAVQESKGVTILVVSLIIFYLIELTVNYSSFVSAIRIEPYRHLYFWFLKVVHISGLFTTVGLFTLKDIFRKVIVGLTVFDLITYIEAPFIKEFNDFFGIILLLVLLSYDVVLIYFFTRNNIKKQFKQKRWIVPPELLEI